VALGVAAAFDVGGGAAEQDWELTRQAPVVALLSTTTHLLTDCESTGVGGPSRAPPGTSAAPRRAEHEVRVWGVDLRVGSAQFGDCTNAVVLYGEVQWGPAGGVGGVDVSPLIERSPDALHVAFESCVVKLGPSGASGDHSILGPSTTDGASGIPCSVSMAGGAVWYVLLLYLDPVRAGGTTAERAGRELSR